MIFCSTELFVLWAIFLFILHFEKDLNFGGFLSVPHLVDNYAKIVNKRCRNFMCDRNLPSLLSLFSLNFST